MKRQCELTAASKQETLNIFVFYEEDIFIKKLKTFFYSGVMLVIVL